jgi:hypothetical protein
MIWSLRTTPSLLVYGVEAILLTNLEHDSSRLRAYNERYNQVNGEDLLD